MKHFLCLISIVCATQSFAASCCVGGGTKSFIQLRNFEKYQLGLSISYQNNYAKFSQYGTLVETKKKETAVSSIGAGARLREDLDVSVLVPVSRVEKNTGLGDVAVGGRFTLLDPLFLSDWYPKINLIVSLKAPTGMENIGNGMWEPGVGFSLEKDYTLFLVNFGASYTYRSERQATDPFTNSSLRVKEGDKFDLSETLILPFSESISFALGCRQTWELSSKLNSISVKDSHGRSVQGSLSSTYFLSHLWKLTLGFESTIPIEGWGTTLDASRSVSLVSTLSIY